MAGHRYSGAGVRSVASPTLPMMALTTTATTRRAWMYHFEIGASATPADNAILWEIRRLTARGTSTAFTPNPLDPGNPAAIFLFDITHTVNATFTANSELFSMPLNQRASFQWWASPESEIVCPATNAAGIGWEPTHASFTGSVEGSAFWLE